MATSSPPQIPSAQADGSSELQAHDTPASPASHLRNALQILQGMKDVGRIVYLDDDVEAVRSRIVFALELLERPEGAR
jgi:hypothetical protein